MQSNSGGLKPAHGMNLPSSSQIISTMGTATSVFATDSHTGRKAAPSNNDTSNVQPTLAPAGLSARPHGVRSGWLCVVRFCPSSARNRRQTIAKRAAKHPAACYNGEV